MKFIDNALITVISGNGGDGVVSFARTRFNPRGGPDGGDGGKGGDVILRVVNNKSTLIDFEYKNSYKADNGKSGTKGFKTGKDALNLYIDVPPGIIVYDVKTKKKIKELVKLGEEFVVAKGGMGGLGNSHFKTAGNRTPLKSTRGQKGIKRELSIELKLLADIALVGMPNAGKSTIISRISNAKPKIADYPFTTLVPNVGVVKFEENNFVVADIPGLIEGASEGVGLGISFLKHIERCRLIAHIVDLTEENLLDNIKLINKELKKYSKALIKKKMFFILNKIDVLQDTKELDKLINLMNSIGVNFISVSAVSGHNINNLIILMNKLLNEKPSKRRLLLYGGSFDPPHEGHKKMAEISYKLINPDNLLIMPCYEQALKDGHSLNPEARFIKTKNYFKNMPYLVSDYEILKEEKTYTIDTISFLKIFYPSFKLYFVMGLDSFKDISKWKDYKKLLKEINIVIFKRNNDDFEDILKSLTKQLAEDTLLKKKLNTDFSRKFDISIFKGKKSFNYIYYVKDFNYNISSSEIRSSGAL